VYKTGKIEKGLKINVWKYLKKKLVLFQLKDGFRRRVFLQILIFTAVFLYRNFKYKKL